MGLVNSVSQLGQKNLKDDWANPFPSPVIQGTLLIFASQQGQGNDKVSELLVTSGQTNGSLAIDSKYSFRSVEGGYASSVSGSIKDATR
jgi:hypothetical protein